MRISDWSSDVCSSDLVVAAPKKTAVCSHCGHRSRSRYDKRLFRARDLRVAGWYLHVEFERWRVNCPGCGGVHVERLDWLAKNQRYTERFALHVGNLSRSMTNKPLTELERLHATTGIEERWGKGGKDGTC